MTFPVVNPSNCFLMHHEKPFTPSLSPVSKCKEYAGYAEYVEWLEYAEPNLPNQTYQTKPTKPTLPKQTYQTKPTNVNKVPWWVFRYVGNKTFDFSSKNPETVIHSAL